MPRVFLGLNSAELADLAEHAVLAPPRLGHAVTDALREGWSDGEQEEWEFSALCTAADDAVDAHRPGDRPRRYVLAVDCPLDCPPVDGDQDERATAVRLPERVELAWVKAIHADLADGTDGPPTEDGELGWYATQELSALVAG